MVSVESVNIQLKKLGFNVNGFWNKAEMNELPNILIPDEEIFECVNGYYEGGAALLVATNIRVILIDKKPLSFLTVEDLRFDMINEMDYSHRLLGANISISVGSKILKFKSYNKTRLRKLINHVQHCIADLKKQQSQHQQGQNQHLEQINQQLQAYLIAQYQNQLVLNQRLQDTHPANFPSGQSPPQGQLIQPNSELADYLFAQSLLRQYEQQQSIQPKQPTELQPAMSADQNVHAPVVQIKTADLYEAGRQEVYGKYQSQQSSDSSTVTQSNETTPLTLSTSSTNTFRADQEINPLRIAYAKLPMALRNRRKFRHQALSSPISPLGVIRS